MKIKIFRIDGVLKVFVAEYTLKEGAKLNWNEDGSLGLATTNGEVFLGVNVVNNSIIELVQ